MRNPGKHATLGLSKRVGPRPHKFKPTKTELYDVIRACKALGFGNDYIGHWTGYSSSTIALYCQDFGITAVEPAGRITAWLSLLPADLQRDLSVMRTKSQVAHERATNRETLTRAIDTHKLVDDEVDPVVKKPREVAPAIPKRMSLGAMLKGLP